MKKRVSIILMILIVITMLFTLSGCHSELTEDDKVYINKIKELKTTQQTLEMVINTKQNELANLNKEIEEKNIILQGNAKYIMKINISQSHFTLDLGTHFKDALNDIDIYIEVSEDFYNKYNVGDIIADDFRVGSMIFKGSFGNWKVKVAEKQII